MNHRQKRLSVSLLAIAGLLSVAPIPAAWAQTAPDLGAASYFAALGGAGVTCTTGGVVGDVGSGLGDPTSITGFPGSTLPVLCTLVGDVLYAPDTTPAYPDFGTAYSALAYDTGAYACPSADASHNLPLSLDGLTLSPGVYCIGGTLPGVGTLSGELTLNGGRDAVWIFKTNSLATTASGKVVMAGGGKACNVYWQTDSEATFANTDFVGTILAGSGITFANSTLIGRALAGTAVTLDTSFITLSGASRDSLKQDKQAFAAEQKAAKDAFYATHPDKAARKAFDDQQRADRKAFHAQQKTAQAEC